MMSSKKPFLKVVVNEGERVRRILLEHNLLDVDYKILLQDGALFMPLRYEVVDELLDEVLEHTGYELGEMEFESVPSGPRTLVEALQDHLSPEELELLPRAYDLIGDIAVLEIPDELSDYRETIGQVFHLLHRNFSTVLSKVGAISGTTRLREYECLAGEDKTDTIHIEYGCRLAVDLSKAYFSPRLLEEHNRVAQLTKDGEFVVDMFCGVGPFPIHIARQRKAHIVAIDINPDAITLLKKSMKMNKLIGSIEPIVRDARDYSGSHIADRVIMNHPSGAFEFVSDACRILKAHGVMHYYDFVESDNPEEAITNRLTQLVEAAGHSVVTVKLVRRVRDSAPYEFQMVVDAVIV